MEIQENKSDPALPEIVSIHISLGTLIIFSLVFSPFLVEGWLIGSHETGFPVNGYLLCTIYFLIIYAVSARNVTIDGRRLIYKVLFFKKYIDLQTLKTVVVRVDPVPRLVLKGISGNLSFNIKPYSRDGLALLLKKIKQECPNAYLDNTSVDLEKGDISSVVRQTASLKNLLSIVYLMVIIVVIKTLIQWLRVHF